MGSQTSTQRQSQSTSVNRTVQGPTGNEAALQTLLTRLAGDAGGQFGDLSALAQGQMMGPTEADRQLVDQSIGASSDMAMRELQRLIPQLQAQFGEQAAARGIQGSSIDAIGQGQIYSQGVQQLGNMMSQQQQMGAQALMQLPFQRAQTQIGANQALFQRLAGTASPVMGAGLQRAIGGVNESGSMSMYSREKSPFDWTGMAMAGAKAYAGGGA
jgi:hypothetical protein